LQRCPCQLQATRHQPPPPRRRVGNEDCTLTSGKLKIEGRLHRSRRAMYVFLFRNPYSYFIIIPNPSPSGLGPCGQCKGTGPLIIKGPNFCWIF
jgi:hypothetical protein